MSLKESGEMYLESIYVLCKERGSVRSIDVAEYMNFSKPSVSRGVGILKEQQFISVDKDGYISLTDLGKQAAEKIFERHTVLTAVLMALGVSEQEAADNACRMEHILSDEAFFAIKAHYEKMKA
ncbi:MAG: metal-dependent transcriptional regulator [Clostridia bacterium]|nr:metal-dependent transcriptional regulator [Clostridia bacterium]